MLCLEGDVRIAPILSTLIGLLIVVYLVVVPEATEASRAPMPDGAPVPTRFAHATRCYRLTFSPGGFAKDDQGNRLQFIQLRDSVVRRPWRWDPPDWDMKGGDLSSFARTHAHWSMAGSDSIEVDVAVHWFHGYALRLSVHPDTLVGRAWEWFDTPDIAPGAAVRAAPVACLGRH